MLGIAIVLSGKANAINPNLTTCKTPSGGKQNICFYETQQSGRVFCLGTSQGQCPSLTTCREEFLEKTKKENKKWQTWSITGRNTKDVNSNSSVPATKNCKMIAEESNKSFNHIKKFINVKCGESPMYLATRLEKEDGSYNNLRITEPLMINGKPVSLDADMYMVWSALMKQVSDNDMVNSSVKTQKIKAESDILKEIKSQGIELSKLNSQTSIDFTYTPPSKQNHDQAIFLLQSGSNSIRQIVVCPDQGSTKKTDTRGYSGYQSFFDEFPVEINIKECAESIYIGDAVTKVGLRSSMNKSVACFAPKDELYCVNADKCMNDKYSTDKFEFKTPLNQDKNQESVPQNSGGQSEI